MIRSITIFLLLGLAAAGCTSKSDRQEHTSSAIPDEVNEYPAMVLQLPNGTKLAARDLKGNSVFVMFQPDCDHCQEEAVHIEQRLEEFKDYKLYFVSSAPMEQITAFAQNFKLDAKDNVTFAWTSTEGVLNSYGPIRAPSVFVYSGRRLKASFIGQTDIQNILNAL